MLFDFILAGLFFLVAFETLKLRAEVRWLKTLNDKNKKFFEETMNLYLDLNEKTLKQIEKNKNLIELDKFRQEYYQFQQVILRFMEDMQQILLAPLEGELDVERDREILQSVEKSKTDKKTKPD